MRIILEEDDYLSFQLFTASQSPLIRKSRIRAWIITTIIFGGLSYYCFNSKNDALGYYFLIITALSLVFYPFYSRWKYKRHYLKHVRQTYQEAFGIECTIEIDEEIISTKSKTGEGKLNLSEISEINEIKDYFFVRVRTGGSLIIPKAKITDQEQLVSKMRSLAIARNIKHTTDLNWKWK